MESLVYLVVHLLIVCVVFALLWWAANAILSLLPPPIAQVARVILIVFAVLFLISFLLGEGGYYENSWGVMRHHRG